MPLGCTINPLLGLWTVLRGLRTSMQRHSVGGLAGWACRWSGPLSTGMLWAALLGGGFALLVPPPPPCLSYALVQATAGVGTVLIWYLILIRYQI